MSGSGTDTPIYADPPRDDGLDIDLRRYWAIIRKRIWIIAAVLAVGVTATVIWTLRKPKIFRATASVVVDPQAPKVFGSDVQEVVTLGSSGYWASVEYYNTQLVLLQSHNMARQTVMRHRLYNDDELIGLQPGEVLTEKQRIARAAAAVSGAVIAGHNKDSRIVSISVLHQNPQLAAKVANMHAETFIYANLRLRTQGSDKAARFLTGELQVADQKLRKAEQALDTFKQKNGVLSVSLQQKNNILASNLARYTAAVSDARIKRINLGAVRARAKKALANNEVLESPIFALVGSGTSDLLKKQYLAAKQKLVELQDDLELGLKHPQVVSQKKKVNQLYASLEREARLAMSQIDNKYRAALASEQQFEAEVARLKSDALALGPKAITFKKLERARNSQADNYKLVLTRLRTSELAGRNQVGNIRPHDAATAPSVPVYPRMKLSVAAAVMFSLLFGVGLAFGLEFLDRTIKSAEDVELLGAPMLGLIPIVDMPASSEALPDRDLYVFNNPTSAAAECCRSIRTNILFSAADHDLDVITVSSASPREGKTTTVIYLGTTMAQSGQKVLLVDTDMRRPRLHKSMGVPRGQGLSTLIVGETTYEDAIKTTDIPNLYVLPCGPTPPNPAELLLTNRFEEILEELKGRFDRIILDSPPMQAVTDAIVLARHSDGIIAVVQAGKTHRDALGQSLKQLRDVKAHVIGVVLNDLDISNKRYGYYYYSDSYSETPTSGASSEPESSHV